MTEQEILEQLAAIGKELQAQDNRCTDQPIFMVQELKRVYGIDRSHGSDGSEKNEDGGRVYYKNIWMNIQPFLTEEAAEEYLKIDGHNHGPTRIYAEGSFRNAEWRNIRDLCIGAAKLLEEKALQAELMQQSQDDLFERAVQLWLYYYDETEDYDEKMCTGRRTPRGRMPGTPEEQARSSRYASVLCQEVEHYVGRLGLHPGVHPGESWNARRRALDIHTTRMERLYYKGW